MFELTKDSTQTKTATTNGLGLATFEELEPGNYTLSEKTPPKNYKKNDKTSTITIAEDGSITWSGELIKPNKRINTRIRLQLLLYLLLKLTPTINDIIFIHLI